MIGLPHLHGERLVFSKEYGGFKTSDRVAVASASKIVSGLVLFSLVGKGLLTLDSTTGAVLGWPAPKDQITLRHLLSFTSGLPPEAPCTANPATTLEACVGTIAALDPDAAPGTRYDYGSTHLHIAARMAEVVTGKTWNTLFDELVRVPLGLPAEVAYFTAPRQSIGKQNPLVAGGLRASMDEYTKILTAIYARGEGAVKAPTTLFDLQMVEPYPGVVVGNSPVMSLGYDFRYGLTAWLECKTPATGCATISSPGAFGFTPWLDRKVGYTAILGMQLDDEGDRADISLDLPASIRAGVEVRPGRWRIEVALDVERSSTHEEILIVPKDVRITNAPGVGTYEFGPIHLPRNFKDTYAVSLGVEGQPAKGTPLIVRAGYAYETEASPTEYLSVLTIDGAKHLIAVGLGYPVKGWDVDLVFAFATMGERTVDPTVGKAPQVNPIRDTSAMPLTTFVNWGDYRASWIVAGLGLSRSL